MSATTSAAGSSAMHTKSCARTTRRHAIMFAATMLGVLALTIACIQPALSGPFIFDDFPNLENLEVLNDGVSPSTIGRYLAAAHGPPARPLAMLSFLIEDAAWPTHPGAYKKNNLLFHLIAGLLVCWLALRLCSYVPLNAARALFVAGACTAAWLLNPMQVSATMLVVQRMNILATIFVVLGLVLYIVVLESRRGSGLVRVVAAGATLASTGTLAYLCKENGVLVFAYAFALNVSLLRSLLERYEPLPRRLLLAGTAGPIVGIAAVLAMRWEWLQSLYATRDFTLGERLLTQPRVLVDSIYHIVLPRIGAQGILHDDIVVSRSLLEPPTTLPSLLLVVAALSMAVAFRRRAPVLAFAILWFFAGHLLESTVLPLELYFEHRNYLPMMGLLFALPYAVARIRGPFALYLGALLAVWVGVLASLARLNAETWGSRGVSSLVWVQENPDSPRAVQWAASYLLDSGQSQLARQVLVQAIERIANSSDLQLQLVLMDCVTRGVTPEQWNENIAVAHVSSYSHLAPMVFNNYVEQMGAGRCMGTLTREMVLKYADALLTNPAFMQVPSSLSGIHYKLGQLYAYEWDLPAVIRHLDLAYAYEPKPSIAREQALLLLRAGKPEEALHYLDISDHAPQPWMKRLLDDPQRLNSILRRDAEARISRQREQ